MDLEPQDRAGHAPASGGRGARLTAALLAAVLLLPLASVGTAVAAPQVWFRTGASVSGGFAALASAATTTSFATTVGHGASTGAFRFVPGATSSTTGFPGSTASGNGYATTGTLSGAIPAGRWEFAATARTDTPVGEAQGVLAVALYAVSGTSSRRLGYVQGSTNVVASPGDRSETLGLDLGEVTLSNERIVTEWYLVISSNGGGAAGATTSLRHGGATDTVASPGPPVAPALGPPGTLTVSSVGDNRVALAWGASSDGRVTGYVLRRSAGPNGPWTDVSTVAGTSATDTGLTNGTRVYHSVVARAADGTRSASTNATSAVPSDTAAPSAPGGVSVAPAGSFRLAVSWSASGAGDVVGYEVQRSAQAAGPFSRVAGPVAGTTFTDEGLAARSTWHYRVVAIDDDGLRSAPTAPSAGSVAPGPPAGLRVSAVADGAVALEWSAVAGAVEYIVERDTGGGFVAVGRPSGTSFTDGGLTNGTTYTYRVRAVDGAGAASSPSAVARATPADTGLPAPPTGLTAAPQGGSSVSLTWSPSGSASTVGYRVSRAGEGGDFSPISGLVTGTSFVDGPLPVGAPQRYRVVAEDASGAQSIAAGTAFTVPPGAPANLRVAALNETTVQLAWDPSNDPRAGYRVLRADDDGVFTAVSGLLTSRSFTDSGLVLGGVYQYVVKAEAVDGTRSASSNQVRVVPTNGPPTPPTGLVAVDTGAGGQVSLSWPDSPEPDVVRYRVERSSGGAWGTVATTSATTYLDRALGVGQTYRYRIVAIDSVGFESAPSADVSVSVTDTEPPPAPATPTVSQTGRSLSIQWLATPTAERYVVLRSTDAAGPFTQVAATNGIRVVVDDSVQRGVRYHYVVQAVDASGNVSPVSAVASGLVEPPSSLPTTGGTTGGGTDAGATDGGPGSGATSGGPGGGVDGSLFPPNIPSLEPGGTDGGTGAATTGGVDGPIVAAPSGPTEAPTGSPLEGLPPLAGGVPEQGAAGREADQAIAAGDLRGALGAAAEDAATRVGEAARTFRVPLVLLLLLAAYLVVQNRIDRGSLMAVPEAATGGDDDDVEYVL